MSKRTYYYCRVSTTEQTVENQINEFINRGYDVQPHRVVSETISGSVDTMKRQAFRNMVENKLERGDTLVVLKLDRLGRDSINVEQTIDDLIKRGIEIHSLDLPIKDLGSNEGKLMLKVFSAFSEFERGRIRERTIEGQARARAEVKSIGRPAKTTPEKVWELRQTMSIASTAKYLGVSATTVKSLYKKAKESSNKH